VPTAAAAATTATPPPTPPPTPTTPRTRRRRGLGPPPLGRPRRRGVRVGVRGDDRISALLTIAARRRLLLLLLTTTTLVPAAQLDGRNQHGRRQAAAADLPSTLAAAHNARPCVHALGDGGAAGRGGGGPLLVVGRGRVEARQAQLLAHADALGGALLDAGQAGPLRVGRGGGRPAGDLALAEAGDVLAVVFVVCGGGGSK